MSIKPISLGFILGVRPEAIKLGPVISVLKNDPAFRIKLFLTGQHRDLLDQALQEFDINSDYDLDLMKPNQSPQEVVARILDHLPSALCKESLEMVMVQGDTATTFAGALSCFHCRIPVAHLEAGLRTYSLADPFPEEGYRKMVSSLAHIHLAPTCQARQNLLNEGIKEEDIFVTGNTVIDALKIMEPHLVSSMDYPFINESPYLLITAHRKDNLCAPMERICQAILDLKRIFPKINMVFVLHKNPVARKTVCEYLKGRQGIYMIEPPNYRRFIRLMKGAYLILTDSGGLQEEGAALGVPVLILRNTTERPEGIKANVTRLVGTQKETIVQTVSKLLTDGNEYSKMKAGANPFGDGQASRRIAEYLKYRLRKTPMPQPWEG